MNLDQDKLEMYRLAIKKVKEAGYELTKDRIWDQYVTICMGTGMGCCLSKHKIEPYLRELGVLWDVELTGRLDRRGEKYILLTKDRDVHLSIAFDDLLWDVVRMRIVDGAHGRVVMFEEIK